MTVATAAAGTAMSVIRNIPPASSSSTVAPSTTAKTKASTAASATKIEPIAPSMASANMPSPLSAKHSSEPPTTQSTTTFAATKDCQRHHTQSPQRTQQPQACENSGQIQLPPTPTTPLEERAEEKTIRLSKLMQDVERAFEKSDEDKIMEVLREMHSIRVDPALLKTTSAGTYLNKLKSQTDSKQVKHRIQHVVRKWKQDIGVLSSNHGNSSAKRTASHPPMSMPLKKRKVDSPDSQSPICPAATESRQQEMEARADYPFLTVKPVVRTISSDVIDLDNATSGPIGGKVEDDDSNNKWKQPRLGGVHCIYKAIASNSVIEPRKAFELARQVEGLIYSRIFVEDSVGCGEGEGEGANGSISPKENVGIESATACLSPVTPTSTFASTTTSIPSVATSGTHSHPPHAQKHQEAAAALAVKEASARKTRTYRQLLLTYTLNLLNTSNPALKHSFLTGAISPSQLVTMTPQEMEPAKVREERMQVEREKDREVRRLTELQQAPTKAVLLAQGGQLV